MSLRLNRTEDLGALVRDRRRTLKLTQGALGARLGVSRKWISDLEGGKSTVHLGLALRAVRDLGMVLVVETEELPAPTGKSSSGRPRISIDRIADG